VHHVKRIFTNPEFLVNAMWHFHEERCPLTKERIYGDLCSGDWWKHAEQEMQVDLGSLGDEKPNGLHFILPLILFDDSTLCDNIGRLMAQPLLFTFGNLSDVMRRSVKAWSILGMVPPYPKSPKEREADRKSKLTQENYIRFYHNCLREILKEVTDLAKLKGGFAIDVPGLGIVNFHVRVCMVIGDTKGHDDMAGHYNCHSSNISRMERDCNIPQEQGDDPNFPCQFVFQAAIEEIVDDAIHVVEQRVTNQIGAARESCLQVSQHLLRPAYWDVIQIKIWMHHAQASTRDTHQGYHCYCTGVCTTRLPWIIIWRRHAGVSTRKATLLYCFGS